MIAIFAFLFTAYSARLIRIGREDGKQQSYVTAVAGVSTDNGVLEIKAGKVRHAETIPSYFELSEDTQALCLNLIVKNISGSEKNFIPLEEIYIQDFEENKYTIEAVPTCNGGVGGPIQTGEVLQGELGFIMPKNKKVEKLVYKPLDNKLKTFIISNIQE
jgi:hypothetical protein